jgi:peptidoglycan glycosyltransferase
LSTWRDAQKRGRRLTLKGRFTTVLALAALAALGAVLSSSLRAAPGVPGLEPMMAAMSPDVSLPTGDAASADPLSRVMAGPPAPVSTHDPALVARVEKILERGRVSLGHVIVMEPRTGKLRAVVSTDTEQFPIDRTYPAASLIKVITAAAALHADPAVANRTCRYVGSPWRLTRARLDPPRHGNESSFRKALAISNNQCFAQLAVHTLGSAALVDAIGRFGFLEPPAVGYPAGSVDPGEDRFALGKLGCGLAGTRITPLHAAQLVGVLYDGQLRELIDVEGARPSRPNRPVITPELAEELREMLVDTTARGTARRAFRDPRGLPLMGSVRVAGKTGSLSGRDPTGRYEWFAGVAPAENPEVAVAVVIVQNDLWWRNASQIAASVFKAHFCPDRMCR